MVQPTQLKIVAIVGVGVNQSRNFGVENVLTCAFRTEVSVAFLFHCVVHFEFWTGGLFDQAFVGGANQSSIIGG